jgi:uncharacterized membrane protein
VKALWHKHPGVRTGAQLSFGERAADVVRNTMGSWPFLGVFGVVMACWIALNLVAVVRHFDPYPFILLNLCLSTLAGLQAAILLIAAKRADQVASEVAAHTLENTELIKSLIQQNTDLTESVHQLVSRSTT